jgi:transposase InsO family protein
VSHRRAKLTFEGRKALVSRIVSEGWPVAAAAEAQCVSAATAYKWVRRFREEGYDGLRDRSSRPLRCPRRLSPDREKAILEMRRRARVGPHRIAWALGESQSTVSAVLRRHREPRLVHLDRPTGAVVRYQREVPGELLHIDIKRQARIPDGGGWRVNPLASGISNNRKHVYRKGKLGSDRIHIAVDDATRLTYLEVHDDEKSGTAQGFTRRAIDHFAELGVEVKEVMTDNGPTYQRGYRTFLAGLGLKHVRIRPYRPQTNGKVERFNRTLTTEWAYSAPFTSNDQRLATLPAWLHAYNYHRPHMALGGRSPIDVLNNVSGKHN